MHFSNDEAQELLEVAIKLDKATIVLMKLVMEVNINETQELIMNLNLVLNPSSKTHGVIFFEALESVSDTDIQGSSSALSREEVEVLQSSTSAHKKVLDDLVEAIKTPKSKPIL